MTEEVFKNIAGFDYSISTTGKVRINSNNAIINPFLSQAEYYTIRLFRDRRQYTRTIHELMAEAFIPNPENKRFVTHINGNREDNNLNNLKWVRKSEIISNKDKTTKSISGIHGVYFETSVRSRPWRAELTYNKEKYFLGRFPTKEAAALAIQAKEKELFKGK